MFDHEKLDVYRLSVEFASLAFKLVDDLPRGRGALGDQLRRAAMSVPLNIAEACGKAAPRDRGRYFASARGSAMECAAVLDLLRVGSELDVPRLEQGKKTLHRVVSMLTRLCL